jgi:excisionase family DNA binding protein
MSEKLMTIQELADYLPDKPTIRTIYGWTSKGLIPFKKLGKKLFFEKTLIDDWNDNNRPPQTI